MLTKDIAAALGASLIGDGAKDIARIVHPDDAKCASDLAVAISSDTAAALTRTRAEVAVVLRNPRHSGHRFRRKAASDSDRKRPSNPNEGGHPVDRMRREALSAI